MKNIKILVNLIKTSLKAQIIIGVVSVAVVGGIVTGGIGIYNHYHPKDFVFSENTDLSGYNEDLEKATEVQSKTLRINELTDSIVKKIPGFQLDNSGMTLDEIIAKLEEIDKSNVTSLGIDGSNVVSKDTVVPKEEPNKQVVSSVENKEVAPIVGGNVPPTPTPTPAPKPSTPTPAPKPSVPAPTPVPTPEPSNEFTGFSYNISTEGRQAGYVGGYNDYISMFPQVSSKSTFGGLKSDVNRAVGALTQGAYPEKVKAKFLGKTYQGHSISNVIIETFHTPPLDANNDPILANDFINSCGATNMVGGLFSSVVGLYELATEQGDKRFFKLTVVLD